MRGTALSICLVTAAIASGQGSGNASVGSAGEPLDCTLYQQSASGDFWGDGHKDHIYVLGTEGDAQLLVGTETGYNWFRLTGGTTVTPSQLPWKATGGGATDIQVLRETVVRGGATHEVVAVYLRALDKTVRRYELDAEHLAPVG